MRSENDLSIKISMKSWVKLSNDLNISQDVDVQLLVSGMLVCYCRSWNIEPAINSSLNYSHSGHSRRRGPAAMSLWLAVERHSV
jgi:hypothetical protein